MLPRRQARVLLDHGNCVSFQSSILRRTANIERDGGAYCLSKEWSGLERGSPVSFGLYRQLCQVCFVTVRRMVRGYKYPFELDSEQSRAIPIFV